MRFANTTTLLFIYRSYFETVRHFLFVVKLLTLLLLFYLPIATLLKVWGAILLFAISAVFN